LEFTLKQLGKLDTKKSTGLDFIHARLLKDAGPAIAGPLTTIMNASLHTGVLADQWKQAKVSVIKKEGPNSDPSNYRPISVLSIYMKVFELAVHNQLYDYLIV
jgi:hypothetical protein